MPWITDDQEQEYRRLKNQRGPSGDPTVDLTRELDAISDHDRQGRHEAVERYNQRMRELHGIEEDEEEVTDEPRSFTAEEDEAFYADLEAAPDGDKNALREVLAKHGRLAEGA
jgi:hypothetical protein